MPYVPASVSPESAAQQPAPNTAACSCNERKSGPHRTRSDLADASG
jgi:hypothetical protein